MRPGRFSQAFLFFAGAVLWRLTGLEAAAARQKFSLGPEFPLVFVAAVKIRLMLFFTADLHG